MSLENAQEVWDFCERMGRDCVLNGADTENCHFTLFSTPERLKAWERGRDKALRDQLGNDRSGR